MEKLMEVKYGNRESERADVLLVLDILLKESIDKYLKYFCNWDNLIILQAMVKLKWDNTDNC